MSCRSAQANRTPFISSVSIISDVSGFIPALGRALPSMADRAQNSFSKSQRCLVRAAMTTPNLDIGLGRHNRPWIDTVACHHWQARHSS